MGGTYNPRETLYYQKAYSEVLLLGNPYGAGRSVQTTCDGDPNGVEVGKPGDIRIQMDAPTIWLKQTGVGTTDGWVPLGDSALGPIVAGLELDVAVLQSDVASLQVDVAALQSASFLTTTPEPGLPNERTLNPQGALGFLDGGPNATYDLFVNPNGISNALLADMPALSVKSNPTGAPADPQDVVAAADNTFFGRQAGALGFFAVPAPTLTQSFVTMTAEASLPNERVATTTATIAVADGGPNTTVQWNIVTNSVGNTLLAQMPANTVKSNPTAALANAQDLAIGTNEVLLRAGGNITNFSLGTNTLLSRAGGDIAALALGANEVPLRAGGNLTNFAVGANTVLGRAGGDIVAAQLVTNQIANNAVTNAKLAQMAARTVKVNATNALADPTDLAGGGAATFLRDSGTALAFSSILVGDLPSGYPALNVDRIIARFDFSNMGNINLTTGTHSLTSVGGTAMNFTAQQQGTTFDILAGTGIRFRADATSTLYNTTTRTAAALSFTMLDFWTAFGLDATRTYGFVMFNSSVSIPSVTASTAGLQFGIFRPVNTPSGAAAGWRAVRRSTASGPVQQLRTTSDATDPSDNYTTPAINPGSSPTTVLGIVGASGGLRMLAGDWDTGTQTWDQVRLYRQVESFQAFSTTGAVWQDQGCQITMAYATGNTNANMSIDTQQLVIYALSG